jgi:hypothetical protein
MASKKKPQRESRYVAVARLAYELAKQTVPAYSHPNSPQTYTQWQLLACVLLKYYLALSYRDVEEWLLATDQVRVVLELAEVPDHATLNRAYHRLRMHDLTALNEQLLKDLNISEEAISVDATGFAPTQASQHYLSRSGRVYRCYVKGLYAVGVESQLILAWRFLRSPASEMNHLDAMRRTAQRYGRRVGRRPEWILLADRGFDGRQARSVDLIVPRRGKNRRVVRPDRRARADLTDQARLDGFLGQRWKAETVFSVMKRKSGEAICSRQHWAQYREIAIRGLVYNLHR